MEQIQEETILALLIDKPAEGIRILTAQYGGLVYSITWRRLQGCLRKEDIEECVSDIFFELYRCRDKIDLSKGSLKTFLLKKGKNPCRITMWNSKRYRKRRAAF